MNACDGAPPQFLVQASFVIHPQSCLFIGDVLYYEISISPSPNVCLFTCFAIFCYSTWAMLVECFGMWAGNTPVLPGLPDVTHSNWMQTLQKPITSLDETSQAMRVAWGAACFTDPSYAQVLWSPRVLVQLVQLVPTGCWFQIPSGKLT